MRDEQIGFRQERWYCDQRVTLRITIEQIVEWQTSLYLIFVDFKKAFDSVDHQTLLEILKNYGIPHKIISIMHKLYDEFTCIVIHGVFPVYTTCSLIWRDNTGRIHIWSRDMSAVKTMTAEPMKAVYSGREGDSCAFVGCISNRKK